MNHNLNLNNDAALTVRRALDDIMAAAQAAGSVINDRIDAMPARQFDLLYSEIRAALGTVRDAQWRIDQIVFHTEPTDSDYGLPATECATCADDLPGCTDPSHDPELEALLTEEGRIADVLSDLLGQLDRGVLTLREFQLSLDSHSISQAHPCEQFGCEHVVPFDDEPFCYTHSPDEGSSKPGYSWLRNNHSRIVPS